MQTKTPLVFLTAGALACSSLWAQEPSQPQATPPPPASPTGTPPGQIPPPPAEQRPMLPPPRDGSQLQPPPAPRPPGDQPPGGGPRPDRPPGGPGGDERGPRGHHGDRGPGRPEGDRGPGRPDGDRGPGMRPPGDRRDGPGERGDRDGRRGRGEGERERGPRMEMPQAPQPFLGVATMPVPPPVSAQLGLADGFGLLVVEVLPNSPAATAGLQKFDVLKLLNDQQLVEPSQLATLVRAAGKDAEVSVTFIRKAQEQKATVKVGERVMPVRPFGGGGPGFQGPHGPMNPEMRERMEKLHERFREHRERFQQQHQPPRPPAPTGDARPGEPARPQADIDPEAIFRAVRPDGAGGPLEAVTADGLSTVASTAGRISFKDADVEMEVATSDGQRTLTVRNPQGTVLFSGPVNTAEERQAVPGEYRAKLQSIQFSPRKDWSAFPPTAEQPGEPLAALEVQ